MPNNNDIRNVRPAERQNGATVKDTVCNMSALIAAEKRCHRGVGYKNSVSRFHAFLLTRIYELRHQILSGDYTTEYGQEFEIFEPKHRIVVSTKYKDRIPQSSFVINYFYPAVIPNLIPNNYACIKGRGVEAAREEFKRILKSARQTDYCLVADMKSYFASIKHETLCDALFRYITDDWARWYYKDVISCNGFDIGLGLGSEINQLSATSLPNITDHALDNGAYERYMDDIRFVGTKAECEHALSVLREMADNLHLKISDNKTYIQPIKNPVKFLGFTYLRHASGRVTMKRLPQKVNNEKRKLRRMVFKGVPAERIAQHYQSVCSVYKKGNRSTLCKMDKYYKNLLGGQNNGIEKARLVNRNAY